VDVFFFSFCLGRPCPTTQSRHFPGNWRMIRSLPPANPAFALAVTEIPGQCPTANVNSSSVPFVPVGGK